MADSDIEKICIILKNKGRVDLAELLKNSNSKLIESDSYGSYSFSNLSSFQIKSPPNIQPKIDSLCQKDKDVIFNSVLVLYPLREREPEITQIFYDIDFDIKTTVLVETTALERISFDYIHEQIKKCKSKIKEKDFEGSVTTARTLIESICLFILESKSKEKYIYDGNLIKLHKSVSAILRMSPGDYDDECLKQILSGVFSIINGVAGLRNSYSDSHGSAPSMAKYKIDERHAILTVNLAQTISEYLFLSYEKSIKQVGDTPQ